MQILTINVTESDIISGKPCHTQECPIALALARRMQQIEEHNKKMHEEMGCDFQPSEYHIAVHRSQFSITYQGWIRQYDLPHQACQFANDFDEGKKVYPLNFVANLYSKY